MSVAHAIMETQQKRKNEMENRTYDFGGFYFGSRDLFQLTIKSIKTNGTGSSHSIELGIELTPEERQELITLLLTTPKKD